MPFVHTIDLLETLKTRLESLVAVAGEEAKAFERVEIFGAQKLAAALKATFASEARVCFVVPTGDVHQAQRDRNFLFVQRETDLVLLIADRVMDLRHSEALVGGKSSIGILELKDRVIDDLFASPIEGVDLAFVPGHGEALMIEAKDNAAGNLGREVWAQQFSTYAGSARRAIA